MKIRAKVFLVVTAVFGLLLFGVSKIFNKIETENFERLEQQAVIEDAHRMQAAIDSKSDDLNVKITDWAQWDDTYEFVQNGNGKFLDSNLRDDTLSQLKLNFIFIENNDGNVVFQRYLASEKATDIPQDLVKTLQEPKILELGKSMPLGKISGIVQAQEGAFVVAMQPITDSEAKAAPRGVIAFGYAIDDSFVKNLSKLTVLKMDVLGFADAQKQANFAQAQKHLSIQNPIYIEEKPGHDTISGFVLAKDIFGNPAEIFRVQVPRDIHQIGIADTDRLNKYLLAIEILEIVIILILFEIFVLRKISHLDAGVKQISVKARQTGRLEVDGSDEFAELDREINSMLDALEDTRAEKKESEERFLNVADSAPVMIWVADESGRIIYVNQALTKFLGKTEEDLFGDAWTGVIHEEDKKRVLKEYKEGQDKHEPLFLRYRVQTASGEYSWIRVDAVVRKTHSGVFKGYIGTAIEEK